MTNRADLAIPRLYQLNPKLLIVWYCVSGTSRNFLCPRPLFSVPFQRLPLCLHALPSRLTAPMPRRMKAEGSGTGVNR